MQGFHRIFKSNENSKLSFNIHIQIDRALHFF